MKKPLIRMLVIGAALLIAAQFLSKPGSRSGSGACCLPLSLNVLADEAAKGANTNAPVKAALPRLVDLGADKCIPCKMMAPILKELTSDYAGKLQVEFIDVWKNPDAAKPYKIKLIPTQIFFDAAGKERFRHEGFFSKEDILKKWKELGMDLEKKGGREAGRNT